MMRALHMSLILVSLISTMAHASDILKIKGTSALIDLKGEPAAPGDVFFALSSDGKKRAIVQITKVKGDKAVGRITKGKADVGMTLEPKAPGTATAKRAKRSGGANSNMHWGATLGYAMDSAKVKVLWQSGLNANQTKEIATLTGTTFSAMGLFDYGVMEHFSVRGLAGLENFNVKGPASCGAANNSTCDSKIMYASASAMARYLVLTADVQPWVGAGVGVMLPLSKSSTAFSAASILSTQVLLAGAGVDWYVKPTMYIPISIEYGMLPKSDQVEANWIELRAGVAVPF